MKRSNIFLACILMMTVIISGCEKRDYPDGLPEYEHYYYAGFLPWNNTGTESVPRTQTALVKFEIQFNSAYVRDYDAVAKYELVTTGISNPAVVGQDFVICDANGTTLNPVDGKYSLTFPKAQRQLGYIYCKVLNSSVAGTRKIEIDLVKNETSQFTVGTFSQAYKRFLEVK